MALSGSWEIPREAVYLDHEVQSGLNKQAQLGFPINQACTYLTCMIQVLGSTLQLVEN